LHRGAQIEILGGQPNAAEPQMQRALAAAAQARDEALRANLASSFAHILIGEGDRLDEALALADVAEANASDIGARVGWRTARARVIARRGRGAQAERLVREGLGLAEQTDSTDLRANALLYAADVRRIAGRPAEAEPFERRALRLFQRRGATAQAAVVGAMLKVSAPAPEPETLQSPAPEPETPPTEIADAPVLAEEPATESEAVEQPPETKTPEETPATSANEEAKTETLGPADSGPDDAYEPPSSGWSVPEPPEEKDAASPPDPASVSPSGSAGPSAEEESKKRWFSR
jgi:hypothetical protein